MTDCYIGSVLAGLTLMAGWFLGILLGWLGSWVLEKRDQHRARMQGEESQAAEDEQFEWFTTPPAR